MIIDGFGLAPVSDSNAISIANMPNWFRIDSDHLDYYELDILEKGLCD